MARRPSFQFYPGDWLNDAALRMVSVQARGLWIDMLCLMSQCEPFGHLKVNHKVILPVNLANIVGLTPRVVEELLEELEQFGVFSRSDDGSIYSRRMVKDEELRQKRAAGGKLGGNPNLKVKHKVNHKVEDKVKQNPTPSSSPSSSSSTNISPNKFTDEDMSIATRMYEMVKDVAPATKKPNLNKWADIIRLMRERDGISSQDIKDVFKWANGHSFWKTNIMSPAKLREQFARLQAQMGSKPAYVTQADLNRGGTGKVVI